MYKPVIWIKDWINFMPAKLSNQWLLIVVKGVLASRKSKGLFGIYAVSPAEIATIVVNVLKVINTLETPQCQTCIAGLIADFES